MSSLYYATNEILFQYSLSAISPGVSNIKNHNPWLQQFRWTTILVHGTNMHVCSIGPCSEIGSVTHDNAEVQRNNFCAYLRDEKKRFVRGTKRFLWERMFLFLVFLFFITHCYVVHEWTWNVLEAEDLIINKSVPLPLPLLTHSDGTVTQPGPYPEPSPGTA
jgi:hypothetical protein